MSDGFLLELTLVVTVQKVKSFVLQCLGNLKGDLALIISQHIRHVLLF